MDQEQELNASGNKTVGKFLTDELKTAWRKFMEKFQQSFDLDQLDAVLSFLRESTCQNPSKKKRIEFMEEEEEMSAENNSQNDHVALLEKRVFGNHLLAKSVFKYLPHSDLLSCRLTISYWNEYATEVLLKRDFRIKFGRKINQFYLHGSKWKSLDMLTQLLRTSKQFPCNKFEFWGGNLENDDAQRFFTLYGSSIKGIRIYHEDYYAKTDMDKSEAGFSVGETDSKVIGRILSHQLPNLEHLILESSCSGLDSLLFPPREKVELPNLKKLTYSSEEAQDVDLLRQILVAATNLKLFSSSGNFDMKYLDLFIETGKVKCIDYLGIPKVDEGLEKLEEIVRLEPEIKILDMETLINWYKEKGPQSWRRISTILTRLLKSNQNSLETIFDLNSLGFLPQFSLPVLENVRTLYLTGPEEPLDQSKNLLHYSFPLLPKGATFSRNFPRLSSMTLSFDLDSEISSDDAAAWCLKCFPTDEIVPTVKKLDIRGSEFCPLFWIQKFSEIFPNVEELCTDEVKDFPSFSKIIWTKYSKLKSLAVEIDMASPLNSYPALDSSFTGLSPEVCNQLGELSTSQLESVAGNYMENEPSLLHLTDLRTLKIDLHFYSDDPDLDYSKILTPVTGICVFQPLEQLQKININHIKWVEGVDHSCIRNLDLLKPYKVTIKYDD